jgi:hypothetical protein
VKRGQALQPVRRREREHVSVASEWCGEGKQRKIRSEYPHRYGRGQKRPDSNREGNTCSTHSYTLIHTYTPYGERETTTTIRPRVWQHDRGFRDQETAGRERRVREVRGAKRDRERERGGVLREARARVAKGTLKETGPKETGRV